MSEKLEIIRLVEQSHLPARQTLDQLGIARQTFYRWYDRFVEGGPEALEDKPSAPSRVWNRIGKDIQDQIVEMALEQTEFSPSELAVRFSDEKRYFASEAKVYRLLKAHDMSHMRSAPMHPKAQSKIERWDQTLEDRILLKNYFLPGDLELQIEAFHQRYRESLKNVTPADAYFAIIKQRETIKRQTIEHRRLQHRKLAAQNQPPDEARSPLL